MLYCITQPPPYPAVCVRLAHPDPLPTSYTDVMEVRFTPEEAADISKLAEHEGIGTEELVKDAAHYIFSKRTLASGPRCITAWCRPIVASSLRRKR